MQDLLNSQNILTFIPCIDAQGRPVSVYRGVLSSPTIRSGGSYIDYDSKWMLVKESKCEKNENYYSSTLT